MGKNKISFQDDYLSSYFMMISFTAKLFIFCCFGTLFEHYVSVSVLNNFIDFSLIKIVFFIVFQKNEEIYNDVINIKWYLLSVKDQKLIMVMMGAAQKPHNIMAGVVPSNLNTFIEVRMYTYLPVE